MDMLLGGLVFAAFIFAQFAAVVAVHRERTCRRLEPSEVHKADVPPHSCMEMAMHHSVFMAGVCVALALLVSVSLADTSQVARSVPDTQRVARYTPACAERDLRVWTIIETFGEMDGMPVSWLAEAGYDYMQARLHCLSDAEPEALALYDRIISDAVSVRNERAVK